MNKNKKIALSIFVESIGLYFSNIDKFIKYMTFPVLGQYFGLLIIFSLLHFYIKHMPNIVGQIQILNNTLILLALPFIIILPGLAIFLKAFWEYLIAYGSINSMFENMLKSGRVYDFDAHTELIKRRTGSFIILWTLIGIFSLISICPLLWVISGVISVFLVLIFQIFTFEPEQTPIGCIKRSIQITKGNFASTFLLLALSGALTYVLIPKLFNLLFEYTNITSFLTQSLLPLVKELPITKWQNILPAIYSPILNVDNISKLIITSLITQIIIQYTLPLRSILWSNVYQNFNKSINTTKKKKTASKKSLKKPSEKLIESTQKKYSSKKLDRNILKRALEKDE